MKANTVYKRAYNDCLALLMDRGIGEALGSETELAETLDVSRTTIRAILGGLATAGILGASLSEGATRRCLLRHPTDADHFPGLQTESAAALVERKFMNWILLGDCRPGQHVNTSELARQFGTSTTAIREYLSHFRHFGLLERRPNSSWVFKGITPEFAAEIYEIRETFELRSARRFAELEPDAAPWRDLAAIEQEHRSLLAEIDTRYRDFSRLDERLHRLVHDASRNRFIVAFYDVISLIFHYHYQWDKTDERERNIVAIHEHLAYIEALRSRDPRAIDARIRTHLRSARATMLRSIQTGPLKTGPLKTGPLKPGP